MEKFVFYVISTVVFFVINSSSVLRLSVSGSAQVFLQSRIYLSLRISLEIVKIYKLYGSDLVFV